MSNYHREQDAINDEKIQSFKSEFPKYIGDFLDNMRELNNSSKTRLGYVYDLRTFFAFLEKDFSVAPLDVSIQFLAELTPLDIQHYLTYLSRYQTPEDIAYNKAHPYKSPKYHTNSPSSKARKLTVVRGLYKYLIRNSQLENNPADVVQIPKDKRKNNDIIAMDNSEVSRMISGAEDGSSLSGRAVKFSEHTRLRDMAVLQLLVGTGLRVSELVGIDIPDIDWNTKSVMVFRKEGKEQRVYMNEDASAAVYDYINNERKAVSDDVKALFVSPRNGTRLTVRSIERIVKKYTENITNQDVHTHSLRSTYATNLYKNTEDIKLVADALGHNNLATVSRYSKSGEANRKRAAGVVNYEDDE
jgi:integrase/recombinase XerC